MVGTAGLPGPPRPTGSEWHFLYRRHGTVGESRQLLNPASEWQKGHKLATVFHGECVSRHTSINIQSVEYDYGTYNKYGAKMMCQYTPQICPHTTPEVNRSQRLQNCF